MIVFPMSVVSPLVLGYCLLRLLAPQAGIALQISLGAGIGAGLLSCCFFVSLVAGLPLLAAEALVLIAAAVFCLRQKAWQADSLPRTPTEKLLGAAFAFAAAAGLVRFLSAIDSWPHGNWDGLVIWNTRARFLAAPTWRDGFSPFLIYAHPDYPLLLPGFIARTWRATGGHEAAVPALAAALFTFATLGVLVSSLSALKGRAPAFIAGILLAGTHFFVLQGASQYADVPLSFFLLSAFASFALANAPRAETPGPQMLPVLAGLAAGLAAWTKNEGWMLVAAITLMSLIAILNPRTRRTHGRLVALTAAGAVPVLLIVLYFKYTFATANDFVGGRSLHGLAVLVSNPARYQELWRGLLRTLDPRAGGVFLLPVTGMVVYAFFASGARSDGNRGTARICAGIIALVFTGYCATVIISPWEITWQVGTALNRLLLHLLPAALFTAFLGLRSIE